MNKYLFTQSALLYIYIYIIFLYSKYNYDLLILLIKSFNRHIEIGLLYSYDLKSDRIIKYTLLLHYDVIFTVHCCTKIKK